MRKWIAVAGGAVGAIALAIACQNQLPDRASPIDPTGANGTVRMQVTPSPPVFPSTSPVPTSPNTSPLPTSPSPSDFPTNPSPSDFPTNPSPSNVPTSPSTSPLPGNPSPGPNPNPNPTPTPFPGPGGGPPPTPSPTPSPSAPPCGADADGNVPVTVTFVSATGRTYTVVASAPATLQPFTDRTWTFDTSTDPLFKAATFLRTPDADTPVTTDPLVRVTFNSQCRVTALFFFPLQMSTDPVILAWLETREGFRWTGHGIPDVIAADIGQRFLYGLEAKDFGTSGSFNLGPIGISNRDPKHMYFLAFSTVAQATPLRLLEPRN